MELLIIVSGGVAPSPALYTGSVSSGSATGATGATGKSGFLCSALNENEKKIEEKLSPKMVGNLLRLLRLQAWEADQSASSLQSSAVSVQVLTAFNRIPM